MNTIGIGSRTSTGGTVIDGNQGVLFNGLVASSVGHQATCPKCKKGIGPIVAVGPRTVTLPAGPAARAGDYVACGCPPGSNSLLAEGSVFIGSEGSMGAGAGRATSLAAVALTNATAGASSLRASASDAPPAMQFRQDMPGDDLPHSLEEEEEEEERALPVQQRITLRLGMFFDGTGNNLGNAALTEECRRQDLQEFDEQTLKHIRQFCETYGYRDTNDDGLYDQIPNGSYGNALSNVALLYDLYEDQADGVVEETDKTASLKVYVDGIGTTGGSEDSAWSMGTGKGGTGVVARVSESPVLIMEKLQELTSNNPQLLIEKIEFDIFGFSRGAAAARHFANEVLKPTGGVLADRLNHTLPALAPGFDWSTHASINFIGLFDTVAAIADPLRANLSVSGSRNPGVNLHLPPGCARKVVHLTAADEHRHNFSLNRVHTSHEELALPGVHSNLGGGYPTVVHERLLIGRPRLCRAAYYSMDSIDQARLEQSRAWRAREAEKQELLARGLPGQGELIPENIGLSPASDHGYRQAKDMLLALGLKRTVRGELSRVALRVMHAKAIQNGAPLDVLSERDERFSIPSDLKPIADKVISSAMAGQSAVLSTTEKRFLHGRYIHSSANWTSTYGFMLNKPRSQNQRAVYEDQPQRGYPV
ncbi:PAAR domain-containing protein [Halopseudomonas sp. Lyrl_26]|uniref:PAAR domain-containing protein n=1 Tax=Halopseudomonas sp. Lyrl_26 TaxID=3110923 RepID=UPI003F81D5F1